MPAVAEAKKPDLTDIDLPYILKRKLLMTEGRWNGVAFPASSIEPAAKALAADPNAMVRICEGAATDHQDSSGTLIGESRNFEWDGKTLWGDVYILTSDAARKAKWAEETGHQLVGISPRMETDPPWSPSLDRVRKITKFKTFGIVLNPAQGEQAMLASDEEGGERPVLDDGPYLLLDAEPDTGQGGGEPKDGAAPAPEDEDEEKGVRLSMKLFCEKCDLLFDKGTEKCSECGGELKEADEATVTRLEEKAKAKAKADAEAKEKKEKEEAEAKAKADEAKKAADAQAQKKYPPATYKDKPYHKPGTGRLGYYAKPDGEFFKRGLGAPSFVRTMALDQVRDVEELKDDFVGLCGEVLRMHDEGALDLGEALQDVSDMLGQIPLSAQLSKQDVDLDPEVAELLKDKRDAELKVVEGEIDQLGDIAPPAVKEDLKALLSVREDAVLSDEGEAFDVAGAVRRIIPALCEAAKVSFDAETKRLVKTKDAKLAKETSREDQRNAGREMARAAGMGKGKTE